MSGEIQMSSSHSCACNRLARIYATSSRRERPRVRRRSVASVPGRPADGRGDRRGDAPHRGAPPRVAPTRADCRPLARRAAHPRSARTHRERPRRQARFAARPQRQGRQAPRARHGPVGLGTATAMARSAARAARRAAVLHHRRPHPRTTLGERRGPPRAAPARHPSRRPAPLRAAPAAPRARARARPRRRTAQHHPAPTRPRQPRHHVAGSGRGAVSALPPVRFPAPPSEPDVHVPAHPALDSTCDGHS